MPYYKRNTGHPATPNPPPINKCPKPLQHITGRQSPSCYTKNICKNPKKAVEMYKERCYTVVRINVKHFTNLPLKTIWEGFSWKLKP
jgi:hypothetical protein